MTTKVAMALSGGVDSSVSAYLLKEQGYEVVGVTFQTGKLTQDKIDRCKIICKKLQIPHQVIDAREQFKKEVIDYFLEEYQLGRTPNPCVWCNYFIKFRYLLSEVRQRFQADKLATGHYVRVVDDENGIYHLLQAKNIKKDQSYFLHMLEQDVLSKVIFPLGEVESKEEVRKLARSLDFPTADVQESQDVCFINSDQFAEFFKEYQVESKPGNIRKTNGEIVGQHRGIIFYTIGQRRGIGIADKEPLYVVRLDPKNNEVIVGYENELSARECFLEKVNLMSGDFSQRNFSAQVKIRYKTKPVLAEISLLEDKKAQLKFSEPINSVTPGQFAVFYEGEEVLGGGVIS